MAVNKSSFLDKVLGRIGRLDSEGLQTVVQRLARERRFLETLFNAIEDGVLVLDETGRILYSNDAVIHLLGLPKEGAEGQPLSRFLPELDWNKFASMEAGSGQRVIRHELEIFYPRPRLLSLYIAPLDGETPGSSGLALIVRDATEARQKTYAAIESERLHALTLLAASVAHEIGNPLNALHIHLQLMERELRKFRQASTGGRQGDTASARTSRESRVTAGEHIKDSVARLEKYLGVAKGEITRLDYIVTQFLQAIRPRPAQLVIASLNEAARETIALLRPEIENRGIVIREQFSRRLPPAPFDPAQIKQALVNLIKNAIQAMVKGGVLAIQTDPGADGVYLSVSDTGRGIAQEDIKRIFEPFYTTKKKGTGLGLMIVQRIVREHNGRIELESRLNKGTTFRIWLPLHERNRRLLADGSKDDLEDGVKSEA